MQFKRNPLYYAVTVALATGTLSISAKAEEKSVEQDVVEIKAVASDQGYEAPVSRSATGLALSPLETPQALTSVSRQQMDDFGLDDLNAVLESTPGVSVERVETDRTYYTARGFDITNFQLDGLGVPAVYGNQMGDLDTALYERVEVLRGANGLMSGSGNPSATVNLVRKRPTRDSRVALDVTAGSWDRYRLQGDVSGTLNETGSVRGRAVLALEDKDSYLDRYEKERTLFYGVIEADLSASTLLTLGHSRQRDNADSPLWGALPMQYTNGNPTDYDPSTSTSADWSYWNNETLNTFAELQQTLGHGWVLTGRLTHTDTDSDSKLFYVYGTPDATTGTGLAAYPSRYDMQTEQIIADAQITGPLLIGGREHEMILGAQWFKSDVWDESNYGQGIGTALTEEEAFDGSYPEPAFDASVDGSEWTHKQASLYGAGRFSLTDRFNLIAGLKAVTLESEGESYGSTRNTEYDLELVPYAGLTYALNDTYTWYASYTEIFEAQEEQDQNRSLLDPLTGSTYETGLKASLFEGQAYAAVSLFQSTQQNVAELAGAFGNGQSYYRGVDGVTSQGVEVDLSGELAPGWHMNAGYTYLDIEDAEGNRTKTETPRHLVKLSSTYRLQSLPGLTLGGSVRWQDEVSSSVAEQDAYALVDMMARYEINPNLTASLNINNLTDEKYINSVRWAQAYYGAPRNAMFKLSWRY
ncbi:TonB-dependent siderophore receptor [Marinobacterium sp. AK62]|uniref:TonB-dependent siderophore receptor n=1 Tax=Marinobacterium alkalitolerans TaxID=1542925 RepID=A0ABS3ZAM5_9GAMM|nr:TonB-dependent siderophore receptor [Marinobacterium alkalitolerans]MBP0048756.1 TonB-dependent siderophore receptor [Marinobacterium alkalitolerans]